MWLDPNTLIVGRGVRTNQDGTDQLAQMLRGYGISHEESCGISSVLAAASWRFPAQLLADDQFEAGPDICDRANFDIDKTQG